MRRVFVCCLLLLMTCTLLHARQITGTVCDAENHPLANVQVYAFYEVYVSPKPVAHVATDADGAFSLDVAEPSTTHPLYIVVSSSGYAINGRRLGGNTPCTIVLKPATPFYGMVVTGKGMPVPGVRVQVIGVHRDELQYLLWTEQIERYTTVSDAHGVITFDGLPADGSAYLAVIDSRYSAKQSLVYFPTTKDHPYRFIVKYAGSLSGHVVDGNGKPLARADVSALGPDKHTVTAADGSFLLTGLSDTNVTISITDPSGQWVAPTPLTATIKEGVKTDMGTIKCCRGGVLSGTVLDALSHQPVSGVIIHCQRNSTSQLGLHIQTTTSDAQGRYQLRLVPGKYDVLAIVEGYSSQSKNDNIDLTNGDNKSLNVMLQKDLILTGDIVDEQGGKLPGVTLYLLNANGNRTLAKCTSNAQGHFTASIEARAEQLTLSTTAPSGDMSEWNVNSPTMLSLSNATSPLTVVLQHAPSGRVVSTTGLPISGASVYFTGKYGVILPDGKGYTHEISQSVKTDAQGEFTLPNINRLKAMTITGVRVEGARVQQLGKVSISNGHITAISDTLMKCCDATIHGTVMDAHGVALCGAVLTTPALDLPRTTCDARGRFTLAGLPEGETTLLAIMPTATAIITATTGETPVTITLNASTTTDDMHGAEALKRFLQQDMQRPVNERRLDHPTMLTVLAGYDFAQACAEAQAEGLQVTEDMHVAYLRALINRDLKRAAAIGPTELELIYTPLLRCDVALELGCALIDSAPRVAAHCCSLAEGILQAESADKQDYRYFRLALLAAWTHHPDLPRLLAVLRAQTKTHRGYESLARYYIVLSESNPTQAGQVWKSIDPSSQRAIVANFIPYSYRYIAPVQAAKLYARLNALLHRNPTAATPSTPIFEHDEIRRLAQIDPATALARLSAQTANWDIGDLVITVAKTQTRENALLLYRRFTNNTNEIRSGLIEMIAHAYALDATYGKQKFTEYYNSTLTRARDSEYATRSTMLESEWANYAYFYSRVDSFESRIILEQSYQRLLKQAKEQKWMQDYLVNYPLAMATIDLERAQQMLVEIGRQYPQVLPAANRKLATYLIGDDETRMTLPSKYWN